MVELSWRARNRRSAEGIQIHASPFRLVLTSRACFPQTSRVVVGRVTLVRQVMAPTPIPHRTAPRARICPRCRCWHWPLTPAAQRGWCAILTAWAAWTSSIVTVSPVCCRNTVATCWERREVLCVHPVVYTRLVSALCSSNPTSAFCTCSASCERILSFESLPVVFYASLCRGRKADGCLYGKPPAFRAALFRLSWSVRFCAMERKMRSCTSPSPLRHITVSTPDPLPLSTWSSVPLVLTYSTDFGLGQICRGCGDCDGCEACP